MSMLVNSSEYLAALESIKREIEQARWRVASNANAELVCMYWRIGVVLNGSIEYGNNFIDSLARDIRAEYPQVKGINARNLRYMAKFAREADGEILHTVYAKLSWSHNKTLMDRVKDLNARAWYACQSADNGWSHNVLTIQIESRLYERQALIEAPSNFNRVLPSPQSELAQQMLKDPYVFDFITARQDLEERDVEEQMVSNVTKLLLELGTGFAFMGRQYHLEVGEEDFYIDLLFYNTKLHCYVVVELKNQKFRPEFTGKLSFYVSAVDGEVAADGDNPTIGLLLCKSKDDVVAEYALRDINQPIGVSSYRLGDELPAGFADCLPSPEDLQARI